jgi:hypothetical protein
MSHELINLTLPSVIQEIEYALSEYPIYPHQSAFSIHELRQQLIAHILSQIPNRYAVAGAQESPQKPKALYPNAIKERIYLETVIHGSILHILRENADSLSHRFSLHREYSAESL